MRLTVKENVFTGAIMDVLLITWFNTVKIKKDLKQCVQTMVEKVAK